MLQVGAWQARHNHSRWHSRWHSCWRGRCQENDGIVPWPPPGRTSAEQKHLREKGPGASHGNVRPPAFMSGSRDTPPTVSSWLGGEKHQSEAFSWFAHGLAYRIRANGVRPGLDSGGTQRPGMLFCNPRHPMFGSSSETPAVAARGYVARHARHSTVETSSCVRHSSCVIASKNTSSLVRRMEL